MQENIDFLVTEQNNPSTRQIDQCDTRAILELINREDQSVPFAVAGELDHIARAVDGIVERIKKGGRLIYFGAGTSGRLGVLDASECLPTFGVSLDLVSGVIAGGDMALREPIEGAEDDEQLAYADVDAKNIGPGDAVVGITASGRTPYVLAVLRTAKERGALTIGVCNNKKSRLGQVADITIEAETGAEVVMGSTRMKAGTAQTLVLNMLSTCSMIKLGKVYKNYMVDLCATNQKLMARSVRMIRLLTDVPEQTAAQALADADGRLKVAILMLKGGISSDKAAQLLEENNDVLRLAIEML